MNGLAEALRENEDVAEFYLGMGGENRETARASANEKSYKWRTRWLA